MRKTVAFLVLAALAAPPSAHGRDDRLRFSIAEALASPVAQGKLGPEVAFYFGDVPHPPIVTDLGETLVNLKTNAFGKSDEAACQWVFLSVAIELQKRARGAGGNAVVGIESFYKKELFRSDTQFMCGAGATVAGVALRGRIVKLAAEAAPAAPARSGPTPVEPKPAAPDAPAAAKPADASPAK